MRLQKTCLDHMVIALIAVKSHLTPLHGGNNPVLNHLFNLKCKALTFFQALCKEGVRGEQGTISAFTLWGESAKN